MCSLKHDIDVVIILESHIENDREYEFWVEYWVGLEACVDWTHLSN